MVVGKFISNEYPVIGAMASSYSFHYMLNVNSLRTTVLLRSDGTSSESIVFGWTYFGITASVGALA